MTQQPISTSPSLDHHLKVDQLSQNLAHRSTRSGALMIVSYAVQLAIGTAGTAVLARLLRPDDFGCLGMVSLLVAFIIILREFLLSATVWQQELTHEQASGLFWINCVASLVVAAAVAALAPFLARFFHEPRLLGITLVISVGILINLLGALHVGLLNRQMRFRAIVVIEVGAIVSGVMVGIAAAWLGAGYWALVFQQMAVWIWQTAAAWCLCR
ncbi:MAG TPA: oligosaccharide flippase family protein, partial [Tepidisphaeraceae bacterium]